MSSTPPAPSSPHHRHVVSMRAPLDAETAYRFAVAADVARGAQAEIGYRLYAVSRDGFAACDVPAGATSTAIVGSHERCDLSLPDDKKVCLRHLLVGCDETDDGCPVLRVLDLETRDGFVLEGGERPRSISATGPIVMRVGSRIVVALPSRGPGGGAHPTELPEIACAREARDGYAIAPRVVAAPGVPAARRVSRVTIMRPLTSIGIASDPGRPPFFVTDAPLAAGPSDGPSGDASGYRLVIESRAGAAGRVELALSRADVDHGVLLGRHDARFLGGGLPNVLPLVVSRGHVLLLRRATRTGAEVVLYDLASTNGTFVGGERVRAAVLPDAGAEIVLAGRLGVGLRWRGASTS